MNKVYVHNYNSTIGIDTTSRSKNFGKQFSPFFLGPVDLYDGHKSQNIENAWQYSKVYEEFIDNNENPSPRYFEWAKNGWSKNKADRYPMGKGRKPLYSYWAGEKLTYIQARHKIYCPLYASAVVKTQSYKRLKELFKISDIHLKDFDGYNHHKLGMSLEDVLNCETKKMGHAFVIAMLLTGEYNIIVSSNTDILA